MEDGRNIETLNYHRTEGKKLSRSLLFKTKRIIKRKKKFYEGASADTQPNKNIDFRIFYVIIDKLLTEIRKSAEWSLKFWIFNEFKKIAAKL